MTSNDLAYRFDISVSTAANIFTNWIENLFVHLKPLIHSSTQQMAYQNLPPLFKDLYPNTRCIIDCMEILIERPYGYVARAQTYSNYKKNNTVKFLIAITPSGSINFLFCPSCGEEDLLISENVTVFNAGPKEHLRAKLRVIL